MSNLKNFTREINWNDKNHDWKRNPDGSILENMKCKEISPEKLGNVVRYRSYDKNAKYQTKAVICTLADGNISLDVSFDKSKNKQYVAIKNNTIHSKLDEKEQELVNCEGNCKGFLATGTHGAMTEYSNSDGSNEKYFDMHDRITVIIMSRMHTKEDNNIPFAFDGNTKEALINEIYLYNTKAKVEPSWSKSAFHI